MEESTIKTSKVTPRRPLTLCIIHEHPRVLLGMKKRGFGAGRWNGFGGKLKEGETIEDAAKREVLEEISVVARDLEKRGIIEFEFQGNPEILEVHIFRVNGFSGTPKESEEMKPEWFHVDQIPYEAMWPDDVFWLPLFLKGKKFKGRFLFGDNDSILEQELSEQND